MRSIRGLNVCSQAESAKEGLGPRISRMRRAVTRTATSSLSHTLYSSSRLPLTARQKHRTSASPSRPGLFQCKYTHTIANTKTGKK